MGGGGSKGSLQAGVLYGAFSQFAQLLCWLCFPNLTPPPLNFLGKYLCQKLGGVVGCLEVGCDLVPSLLLRRPFDTIDKVFS